MFLDEQTFRQIIREELEGVIEERINSPKMRELPPLLTREQAKQVLGVNNTKMSELISRRDFPVLKGFGTKIPTKQLFEWIERRLREETAFYLN